MIYSLDLLAATFAMMTGFAASWIVFEIARSLGWREERLAELNGGVLRRGFDLVLAALVGPRVLLVNGFANWRGGAVSLPLYTVLALIAVGWSMCSGVVVLQAAFASGYFLA
ncbi:hypothetical protein [uncultured Hoeflea sp.]|uniref:DUF6949 family protein n=1 Tax=uncultured Hoeflea sp. TaxID=538666 RepID=UPI00261E8DE1|nr:hypothetical protein [uncultured Hoeflea sp.]